MSKVEVDIGPQLDEYVKRVIRQAAPTVVPRMEQEIEDLLTVVRRDWPLGRDRRGRPHTRNAFEARLVVTPDGVEAQIVNTLGAPYFFQIRSVQNNLDGKSPFVRLIRTPARKRAKALAEDLSEDLARLAGG